MFTPASVSVLPRLAQISQIEGVEKATETEKKVYHCLAFSLKPITPAGVRLIERIYAKLEWFSPGFDPGSIQDEKQKTTYRMLMGSVWKSKKGPVVRPGTLTYLFGDNRDKAGAVLTAITKQTTGGGGITWDTVHAVLQKYCVGNKLALIARQRSEKLEDGERALQEGYEVQSIFPITEEGRARMMLTIVKAATTDDPIKITWEENAPSTPEQPA